MKDEFYSVLITPLPWGSRTKNPGLVSDKKHDHWTDSRIDRANNIIEGLFYFAASLEKGITERFREKPEEMTEANKETQKEARQLVTILNTFLAEELEENSTDVHYTSTNRMEAEI